ncbi:AraC family transcriptional regulator [uncultured Dokdonia sp.]|uniref:helix-turn-helix domain-containing protein n=1 Tax=uncultured Dokdonia sp. TaxID=575653 RepID=UPI00260FFE1C|nr:AraC family transcriptional regulator [uncultured Dokdonia sp.]
MKSIEYILIVLLSVGAFQGIVYGIILSQKRGMHFYANRFLAAILFFFSYRLLVETSKIFGYGRYDFWYQVLLEYNWIYGTLLFFFVKSYVNPDFRLKRKDYIHFLPVLIEIIWSFFIKSQNFYWDGTRESLSWLGYYGYMAWMRYPTMYVISSALLIYYTSTSQKILSHLPELTNYERITRKLQWIKRVVIIIKIFAIAYIIGILVDYFFFNFASNLFYGHPVFIGMAIITYWLGIEGFSRRKDAAVKPIQQLSTKEQKQLEEIAISIQQLMKEESLYKDPELTLGTLSRKLHQKPYLVTKSLNNILQKKFTDYINELRIEEVKRMLEDPKSEKYTLLSIAYDAGFNSKASFNRAVKKITGKPPTHLKTNK